MCRGNFSVDGLVDVVFISIGIDHQTGWAWRWYVRCVLLGLMVLVWWGWGWGGDRRSSCHILPFGAGFSSFSLCFWALMCEWYVFSVVLVLLAQRCAKDLVSRPFSHMSHVTPLDDVVTAVSARLWRTFWLNMPIGSKDATRRCNSQKSLQRFVR